MESSDLPQTSLSAASSARWHPPAPFALPDLTYAPPTTVEGANWLIYSSPRRGVSLQLTEHEIHFGDDRIAIDDIYDVAFFSPKRGHHEVLLAGSGHTLRITLRSNSLRRVDASHKDFVEVVSFVEKRSFANLVQSRIVRIGMGLPVRIGKLELHPTGLRMQGSRSPDMVPWAALDHVELSGSNLTVMARRTNGRQKSIGVVPLEAMNAVLLPALLPAAAKQFRSVTPR